MNKVLLQRLIDGKSLDKYKGSGNSMTPLISSKQPIHIDPIGNHEISIGDIVVVKVRGRIFCHLVTAIDGDRVQISNNHGHVNGWTHKSKVFGIVTKIYAQ